MTEYANNHKEMGVRPGWAMDLMTGFGFTKPQHQAKGVETRERVDADASDRRPRVYNVQLVTKLERR